MDARVRPAYTFRRSRLCKYETRGRCVEVATNIPGVVAVRDSKTGTTQEYSTQEWMDFLAGAKAGEFDVC